MNRRIDPDELASLEEQRDHLLASLEDLESEFAAGDLDEGDYDTLKDDYTVRASDVLEAIAEQRTLMRARDDRRTSPARTLLVTAGVLGFALVAGLLVARGAGQRGDGPITGAVDNLRARLATCQQASMQDPDGGIECYDEILAIAPDNVEALTYQGWAFIRADQVTEGARNLTRAVELDPDAADPRVFRAVLAARAGDHALAHSEVARFYRNRPSPASVAVLQSQGLEREIFIELIDPVTRSCWIDAAQAQDTERSSPEDFLGSLGACLDGVLDDDPDNVDALVSRAYAVGSTGEAVDEAAELADRAVAADADAANARLLRATILLAVGDLDGALVDLEVLDATERPTASFLFGGPEQVRTALDSARRDGAPASGAEANPDPGDRPSVVPNPGGG